MYVFSSPVLLYLRSKYLSQQPILHTLGLFSSRSVRNQISHPYETKEKIFLYIFIFIILGSKLEDKRQYKKNENERLCASSQFFTFLTNQFNN